MSGLMEGKKTPGFIKAIFGSREQKANYYEPMLQKAVDRNKLTPEEATAIRQAILDGDYSQFFKDAGVGLVTHWIAEKATLPFVYNLAHHNLPSEQANSLVAYYGIANLLAIPYFLPRAVQEYKRLGERIGFVSRKNKFLLTGSVLLNAVPIASAFTTPMLNFPRFEKFCEALIHHHEAEIKAPVRKAFQMYKGVII